MRRSIEALTFARIIVLALAVGTVAGCGDAWPKTAGNTSCAEWLDEMTVDQPKGLSEAILTILWNLDGAAETPPEEKVLTFANAIGGVCGSWRNEKVSTVGAGLYLLSDDIKP